MCGLCNEVRKFTSSGNSIVDGVTYGTGWKGPITYYFTSSSNDYNYTYEAQRNFAAATEQQAGSALFALERSFGTAANDGFSVEGFTRVSISSGNAETSNLRFAQSDVPATAYAYMPGKYEQAGDMWFGRNFDYTNAQAGNYAWHSILHEIGHALGLKHGHEAQNGFAALPADYDSLEYSVMTYRSYKGSDISSYSYDAWSAPQSYMMADIAALQKMYGADYTTNRTDTVYSWNPGDGDTRVNGEVGIDAGGTVIFATIWDGGGSDTYDLSAYASDVTISLAAGGSSRFGSDQLASLGDGNYASGSIYNALRYHRDNRSLIENATGGSGADVISGNAVGNVLQGNDGDDQLTGLFGNDRLYGGAGADLLSGGRGIDRLFGGAGDDILTGGRNIDVFHFQLGGGADTITDFTDRVDRLYIDDAGIDIAQLIAGAVQVDADVVIRIDETSSMTLAGFDLDLLDRRDFFIAA